MDGDLFENNEYQTLPKIENSLVDDLIRFSIWVVLSEVWIFLIKQILSLTCGSGRSGKSTASLA